MAGETRGTHGARGVDAMAGLAAAVEGLEETAPKRRPTSTRAASWVRDSCGARGARSAGVEGPERRRDHSRDSAKMMGGIVRAGQGGHGGRHAQFCQGLAGLPGRARAGRDGQRLWRVSTVDTDGTCIASWVRTLTAVACLDGRRVARRRHRR